MSTTLVVILFTVGALALFVVGMSLTLIFKGHHIDSEIATNKHMQERGITCAVHDAQAGAPGENCGDDLACGQSSCATCETAKP